MSVPGDTKSPQLLAPLKVRDMLEHAFLNARLIRNCVIAGLLVGLLAAIIVRGDQISQTLVLVQNGPEDPPESVGAVFAMTAVPRAVQADAAILESEPVLRGAARRLGPAAVGVKPAFGGLLGKGEATQVERAAKKIRKALRVDTDPGSSLIKVTYAHPDGATALKVMQAVLDSYMAQRRAVYTGAATEVQRAELNRYGSQLADLDARIKGAQQRFGVLNIAQEVQLVGARQDSIAQRISQVRERARAVDGELATANARLNRTPDQVFDSREVTNGTPNDDARNLLSRLRQERAHLVEQYQPDYPGIKEIDARIAIAERQVADNRRDQVFTEKRVRNPDFDTLKTRISSLSLERAGVYRQLQELGVQQTEMQSRVEALRQGAEELADLQRRRDALEAVYRTLSLQQAGSRLRDNTVLDPQAAVRVVQPPNLRPASNAIPLLLLLSGPLVGLAAAGAIMGVRAIVRQTFLTPTEVERLADVPVVSTLPAGPNDELPQDSTAISQLATFILDVGAAERPLNVVQLASAGEGQDNGPVSLLLAREFVNGFGRKTLLIDTNGELYEELSHLAQSEGVLAVDGVDLRLIRTRWDGLWAVSQPANQESPFTSARLPMSRAAHILGELRRRFQQVIVVAPQEFGGYAARRLYPLADAHLLTVRAERTRAPALRALREAVLSGGGDILGAVFTRRRFYIPERVYRWAFG
ncbi:hypothetical protein [Phenylobacterium sp.]|jgi:uncharacterized protein involved in exopolysaccharide biosynthesis|uniref:hypothetical protein n=1 Tax=Phenylobacterium sp. TaxID=1871053 RepID=UPI0037837DB0